MRHSVRISNISSHLNHNSVFRERFYPHQSRTLCDFSTMNSLLTCWYMHKLLSQKIICTYSHCVFITPYCASSFCLSLLLFHNMSKFVVQSRLFRDKECTNKSKSQPTSSSEISVTMRILGVLLLSHSTIFYVNTISQYSQFTQSGTILTYLHSPKLT